METVDSGEEARIPATGPPDGRREGGVSGYRENRHRSLYPLHRGRRTKVLRERR